MDTVLEMSDVAMWSLIVGFLSPPIMSIIQQPSWSNGVRAFVAFLWSVVAGGVTVYLTGDLEGKPLVTGILLVMVTSMVTYKNFWKPTNVSPTIEAATSSKREAVQ